MTWNLGDETLDIKNSKKTKKISKNHNYHLFIFISVLNYMYLINVVVFSNI